MSRIKVCIAFLLPLLSAQAQFGPEQSLAQSDIHAPGPIHALDMDGDGDRDILLGTAAGAASHYYFLWCENDGNGTFALVHPIDSTSSGLRNFILTDLDMDGNIDIVAVSSTALMWYAGSGAGQFGPPVVIATAEAMWDFIAVADMDGDGDQDIINGGLDLRWLENNGSTSFPEEHAIPTTADILSHVAATDVDDDGDMDVVFSTIGSDEVRVTKNNGSGGFSSTFFAWGEGTDFLMVRLDADAFPDMIVRDAPGAMIGELKAYRNMEGMGTALINTLSTNGGRASECVDMDGDGRVDVLGFEHMANGDHICWWRQGTNGQFGPAVPIMQASWAGALAWSDLNGDGSNDLVLSLSSWDQVRVHLNTGSNTFGEGQDLLFTNAAAMHQALVDMDGDGDQDLLATAYAPARLFWRANDGSGQFGTEQWLLSLTAPDQDLITADIDGDGDMDAITASARDTLIVYLNDGAGAPAAGIRMPVDEWLPWSHGFALGDADGDGDLDVLCMDADHQVRWLRNDGSAFVPWTVLMEEMNVQALASADLDGDGDVDAAVLVYSPSAPDSLFLFSNTGGGDFVPAGTLVYENDDPVQIYMDDLDLDGDLDLLLWNTLNMTLQENLSAWEFAPGRYVLDGTALAEDLVLVDLDQDGDNDVVSCGDRLAWSENTGALEFGPRVWVDAPASSLSLRTLTEGDIDGDGDLDLLIFSGKDNRSYWRSNRIDETAPVTGSVYYDVDSNGVAGPDEPGLPYVQVTTTPDAGTFFTDHQGRFRGYLFSGSFEIGALAPEGGWSLSTDSATYHVALTAANVGVTGLDFGFKEIPAPPRLSTALTLGRDGCSVEWPMRISVRNEGSSPVDGIARLSIDTLFGYAGSDWGPDSVVSSSIYWSFEHLLPGQYRRWDVRVGTPDADELGEEYLNEIAVTGTNSLGLLATFTDTQTGTVSCGYDPNAKYVEPRGYGAAGYVDVDRSDLVYTIHFQNTGNDTAYTVVLHDELDHHLDKSTFEVMGFSHPFELSIATDGEAIFTFENILLPDSGTDALGSQGFVKFRIGIEPGLPSGTLITNTAAIDFDNNASVLTNTVNTTLIDCSFFTVMIEEPQPFVLEAEGGTDHQWFLDGDSIPGATSGTLFVTDDGAYTVSAVDMETGCTGVSEAYTVSGTGIVQEESLRLMARPDPFTDRTELVFSAHPANGAIVTLLDMNGRVQRTIPCNGARSVAVERGSLPAGVYVVRLCIDGKVGGVARLVAQ